MNYGYWIIIGGIFFIVEIMSNTLLFLFLGASSFIMALIIFMLPNISDEIQLILSSVLAIASIIFAYYLHKKLLKSKENKQKYNTNDRLSKYIGLETTLSRDVINGIGEINLEGSTWRVIIDSGRAGNKIIITGVQSTSFIAKEIN